MLASVLTQIIASTFKTRFGKSKPHQAMVLHFQTSPGAEYDGHARWTLLLWAPDNYLQVWVRKEWDRISVSAEEDADYEIGAEPWMRLSNHDSGWRSAIQEFIRQHQNELFTLSEDFLTSEWFRLVKIPEEVQGDFERWLVERKPMSDF